MTRRPTRPKMVPTTLACLRVDALAGDQGRGRLLADGSVIACALGAGGIVRRKREGDGGSPHG
ncbi:L,D-transpeptidase catalytic domain protein, partial [Methylobacterium trifolii]